MWPDDDVHLMVRPEHAKTLAAAIVAAARTAMSETTVAARPLDTRQSQAVEPAPQLELVAK
jgi:hypothetical protein